MSRQDLWPLIQSMMQAFSNHYREAMQPVLREANFQGPDWFLSFVAYGIDPEPVTADFFHTCFPYANIENQKQNLALAAEHGFLEETAPGSYRLTEKGRNSMERFYADTGAAIAELEPLPAAKMQTLADFFGRIITTTETAQEPAFKSGFLMSRRTDIGNDAPPALRIDQYVTDMLRYHDDAHIAAWLNYDVAGQTWETLTYLWRDQAYTAAELAEQLQNRNYDEADYAAALQNLVQKGWAIEDIGEYQITEAGRKVRETAEAKTEENFFVGWSALNDEEQNQFEALLRQLRDRLNELAADEAIKTRGDLWPLAREISGSIFKLTRPVMDPLFAEMALDERGLVFNLLQAAGFDPEPVSGKVIARRRPYSNPSIYDEPLAKLAEKGLLAGDGDGDYYLTENGRSALSRILDTFRNHLGTIETDIDLDRLDVLLGRIVNTCLNAPEPPGTTAVALSHKLMPADDAPALAKIDQLLDDLNAFRDDAHLASFAPHEMSGHGWELFTMLWRGDAATIAEVLEKVATRGHDEATYTAALDDLVARGWVKADGDKYVLTPTGKEIRDAAELQTDRYFYLPWATMNLADTDEMRSLMIGLNQRLAKLAEATAVPA